MRLLAVFLTAFLVTGAAFAAGDEFGQRFGGETPVALEDFVPPGDEVNPQDIEPAAGNETAPEIAPESAPESAPEAAGTGEDADNMPGGPVNAETALPPAQTSP